MAVRRRDEDPDEAASSFQLKHTHTHTADCKHTHTCTQWQLRLGKAVGAEGANEAAPLELLAVSLGPGSRPPTPWFPPSLAALSPYRRYLELEAGLTG